ncbi:MAG: type IV pili methyl-accepting chemotaxis transducer N-terminal domain-containing protein, partial [Bacteroidota bacterium]
MTQSKHKQSLDTATFQRIQKWYLLALAAIAVTIIIAQILIQQHLNSQLNDSRVINVAGRQRAYSQKLVKEVLLLKSTVADPEEKNRLLNEIQQTLTVWKASHDGLQYGNADLGLPVETNQQILLLFQELSPHHSVMVSAVEDILDHTAQTLDDVRLNDGITILLQNERTFLTLMDGIVNEYDKQSKAQLQNLKYKEYLLLGFSLLILLLEMLFIFRPLSVQIRETIANLMQSRLKSDTNAREIQQLFKEKEKSLQELQELNFVIDNAALFASAKKDGSVVFMSKKFLELLGYTKKDLSRPLSEILTKDEGQQQYLREILKSNTKQIRSEEIEIKNNNGIHLWLDMSIIPMHQSSLQQ